MNGIFKGNPILISLGIYDTKSSGSDSCSNLEFRIKKNFIREKGIEKEIQVLNGLKKHQHIKYETCELY